MTGSFNPTSLRKKKIFFFFSQKGLSFLTTLSKRSSLETLLYPISLPQSPLLFLLLFSHSVMSDSLQPHGLQHTRFPFRPLSSRVHSRSCPLSHWYYPTISSSVIPFSSCLQSFPESGSFKWVSSSHQVATVSEFHLQLQSFQWIFRVDFLLDWLIWSLCCPRDSQESSPAPQVSAIMTFQVYLAYGC